MNFDTILIKSKNNKIFRINLNKNIYKNIRVDHLFKIIIIINNKTKMITTQIKNKKLQNKILFNPTHYLNKNPIKKIKKY